MTDLWHKDHVKLGELLVELHEMAETLADPDRVYGDWWRRVELMFADGFYERQDWGFVMRLATAATIRDLRRFV